MPPKKQTQIKDWAKITEKRQKCIQRHRNHLTKKIAKKTEDKKPRKQKETVEKPKIEESVKEPEIIHPAVIGEEIQINTKPENKEKPEQKETKKRCPKGTRRNKLGVCEPILKKTSN